MPYSEELLIFWSKLWCSKIELGREIEWLMKIRKETPEALFPILSLICAVAVGNRKKHAKLYGPYFNNLL